MRNIGSGRVVDNEFRARGISAREPGPLLLLFLCLILESLFLHLLVVREDRLEGGVGAEEQILRGVVKRMVEILERVVRGLFMVRGRGRGKGGAKGIRKKKGMD